MGDSTPSSAGALPGLAIDAVEWLPSGAESGLVRVRARWTEAAAAQPQLPALVLVTGGHAHRFESLPDARFGRDPSSWRGSYLVPAGLVAVDPEALWIEWPGGVRSGLPPLTRGLEPPPVDGPERPELAEVEPGGQVIDRAVLAERRARRAEAAEQAQARVAAEAVKAVEVLELRSAELERRLAEATAERDALVPALERGAPTERERRALASALETAARLRGQSRDWRLRLRTTEIARATDAVRLAVLEAQHAATDAGALAALHGRERELEEARQASAARASELATARGDATAAREELDRARAAATSELDEARGAWERRREELESALADVRSALAQAREEVATAHERARIESQAARERDALAEALAATEAAQEHQQHRLERLEEVRSDLERRLADEAAARGEAEHAAAEAEATVMQLRTRLEAAELAASDAGSRVAAAQATAATADARLRVETVARAALEDELDRERSSTTALRAERDAAVAELRSARAALESARHDATTARAELEAARGDAEAATTMRAELDAARAALEPARRDAEAAHRDVEALRDEVVEARDDAAQARDEAARDRADAEAARGELAAAREELASVRSSAEAARGELDAARSELGAARVELAGAREQLQRERAARAEAGASLQERIGELERVAATASSAERLERLAAEQAQASAARESSAAPADIAARLDAAAAALRARETQPAPEVPVADEVRVPVARPTGQGPVLRSAIVRLAKDDPDAAGRLLAALLPAQGGVVEGARSYDVTIKGVGTYAITMQDGHARAARVGSPRSRRAAAFHLSADPLVLAELLTGVEHRIGRFFGPARLRGRRRRLAALEPLVTRPPDLTTVARSGARIEPDLAWRVLGYAVHPSWTRGLEFTVAQTIVEATTERTWYLTARDGGGLAVTTVEPETPPAATVTMSRTAFDRLLRDEPYAPGDRPAVRGDREAVGTLLDLADRAARG